MRWIFALILAVFLSLSRPGTYFAQPAVPVTVEAYWEMVGDTRQAIMKMAALPVG